MCHVVHVKTTTLGSQTETWKRLITLLQTQHKVAPTGKTYPELHYEWLHPMELEERESLRRERAAVESLRPPEVQSEPSRFKEMLAQPIPVTQTPQETNARFHRRSQQFEESPSAHQGKAEDWEEDPGVHKPNEILHVPSVVSSTGWQTWTRRPMNLKYTPNFNTKQLTASPQNGTSRPSRQSHLLNCLSRDIFKHYLTGVSSNSIKEHYLETHVADTCLLISRRVICIHDVMTDSGQPETHENTVHQSTLALPTSSNRGSCM